LFEQHIALNEQHIRMSSHNVLMRFILADFNDIAVVRLPDWAMQSFCIVNNWNERIEEFLGEVAVRT